MRSWSISRTCATKALRGDKLFGMLGAFLVPSMILDRVLGLHRIRGDDVATVIFTSGSTGMPKGVMLTHHNIATNVEAIEQVVHPRAERFDSRHRAVFSFARLHGHAVGPATVGCSRRLPLLIHSIRISWPSWRECARRRSCLATPTFLRTYLRRCEPEELSSLEVVVAGAEKLPIPLCDAFEKKFGIRPVEGYGTTELSPLVSVNVPPSRSKSATIESKEGSVGRPVPGVVRKGRRSGNVRRLAARHARHAAGEGTECDERLPRPAGGNGQGDARRLVHHGRHRD